MNRNSSGREVQPTFASYCVGRVKRRIEKHCRPHFLNSSKVSLPTSNCKGVSIFAH
jgi:hypothetical protein